MLVSTNCFCGERVGQLEHFINQSICVGYVTDLIPDCSRIPLLRADLSIGYTVVSIGIPSDEVGTPCGTAIAIWGSEA